MHAFPAARDAPTGTNHTQTAFPRALTLTPSVLDITSDAFRALSSALVARVRAEGDPMPAADSMRDAEELPAPAWIETREACRAPPTADVILVNAHGATLDANDASAFVLHAAVRPDPVTRDSDDVMRDAGDETVEACGETRIACNVTVTACSETIDACDPRRGEDAVTARPLEDRCCACLPAMDACNVAPHTRNATCCVGIATIRAYAVTLDACNEAVDAGDAPTRRPGVAPDGNNAYRAAVDKILDTRCAIPGVLDKGADASPPSADSND